MSSSINGGMQLVIDLSNPRYGITGKFDIKTDIWQKHLKMHPVRPEEALQNNLSVCYGLNVPVTAEMIGKVINDEYNMARELPDVIKRAREEKGS
jgi:hypothetical protein